MADNLPSWPGASAAYSKAYRILERLASRGHVTRSNIRGKCVCFASEEMADAIEALNKGEEEAIKAFNLEYLELAYEA